MVMSGIPFTKPEVDSSLKFAAIWYHRCNHAGVLTPQFETVVATDRNKRKPGRDGTE
jgi:hypothetical protein